uniref:hypothetical protein n=1 Tax=Roseivirga sp. TaxID=1964215 RepID=UPI004047E143
MKKYLVFSFLVLFMACEGSKTEDKAETLIVKPAYNHPESINKVFDAHGGYQNWAKLKTLSYESGGSKTLVELQNRYTLIESENQKVGFDGKSVWVNPPSENAAGQRMRYNLMFYFYAFPFVVGDPGVNYEALDAIELGDQAYNATKITYDSGIGDAPNDSYIILSNPETNKMEWLMYTATFGGEPSDRYSLIKYEGWKEMGGVILPSSLQWYQYAGGVLGQPRGDARLFENIQVSEAYPAMENFVVPEGAQVVSGPQESEN